MEEELLPHQAPRRPPAVVMEEELLLQAQAQPPPLEAVEEVLPPHPVQLLQLVEAEAVAVRLQVHPALPQQEAAVPPLHPAPLPRPPVEMAFTTSTAPTTRREAGKVEFGPARYLQARWLLPLVRETQGPCGFRSVPAPYFCDAQLALTTCTPNAEPFYFNH
jgi:hypothetical protein